jgi:hypothetical protein
MVDQIPADPLQWQALSVFSFKPEQIQRLSITTDKQLSLQRSENNQWGWLKGAGQINDANVQLLVNTLSSLHATRWIGTTKPQDGLEKPQLSIEFTTSADDKVAHKLIVGAAANDGTWCAHVEGREGTFTISNSDLNTLRLPLIAQPSATPSPVPSLTP